MLCTHPKAADLVQGLSVLLCLWHVWCVCCYLVQAVGQQIRPTHVPAFPCICPVVHNTLVYQRLGSVFVMLQVVLGVCVVRRGLF